MKIVDNILIKASESDVIDGELYIPDGVTEIAKNACAQNFALERLKLPASVQSIDSGAFCECTNLRDVEFEGDTLEYLGMSAFSECTSLDQISLPKIEKMGTNCFENCDNLQMTTISGEIVGENCFINCENLIQVDFLNSPAIKESAFKNCRGLMYLSAPNGITSIDNFAFENCKNLFSMEINSNIDVSENAFVGSAIEELKIVDKSETLKLDNQIFSFSNNQNAMIIELGDSKQTKQVIYVNHQNNKCYKFNFEELNDRIKDFSDVYKIVGVKTLVEWVDLLSKVQNIVPEKVRLPQAEAILTLKTDEERLEFIENLGKYNKISGKYRNLNLYDRVSILKLCKLLGVFEKDDKQFVYSANILSKDFPNWFEKSSGQSLTQADGSFCLLADWFNRFEYPRNFSAKRAKFFVDNYKDLLGAQKSELLSITLNNFEDFSKSVKVVTPDKVEQILTKGMTTDVSENRKELMKLMILQGIIDRDKFEELSKILHEAEQNYPNIYDNVKDVKSKNFDRSKATKLIDNADALFQFEWLDKDSPYTLLIGNICGCCARLHGVGEDIMVKSATHPDVQTMAIKRKDGEYIGKATIYLNREEGYAVFNNIELNRNFSAHANFAQRNEVLDAFLRGVNAFVKTYNSHAVNPLRVVTVGAKNNKVISQICARLPQSKVIYPAIEYKNYCGDSSEQQFIAYDIEVREKKNESAKSEINK